MDPVIASAARRGVIAAGGLAATLCAHVLVAGPVHALPVAPLLWLTFVGIAVLPGLPARAARGFAAWSTARIVGLLALAQLGFHAVLVAAPWTLGLAVHHHGGPFIEPRAAMVHAGTALVFTLLIRHGQRWVVRALAVVASLLAAPRVRRAWARPSALVAALIQLPPSADGAGTRTSRGPPAGGLRAA